MAQVEVSQYLDNVRQMASVNRRLLLVVTAVFVLTQLVSSTLNELRTRRITGIFQTTPADVKNAVVPRIEALIEHETNEAKELAQIIALFQLVQELDDVVVGIDTLGFINRWSRGASEMFGWRSQDVLGRHIGILMTEEDAKSHAEGYPEAVRQQGGVRRRVLEVEAVHMDGHKVPGRLRLWIASEIGAMALIEPIE